MGTQGWPRDGFRLGSLHFTVAGRELSFPGIEQLFVQFLSWTQADEFDLYFAGRFPALANQRMRQIEYADRTAHVQDQDVAMLAHSKRLQNQRHSFWNCHEKSGYFRVGDRDAPLFFDLLLKHRNHAALRPHDVPKPHGDTAHVFSWPSRQNEFYQPLGGGGVENNVYRSLSEYLAHARSVGHIGDRIYHPIAGSLFRELQLQIEHRRFRMVQHDQLSGRVRENLTAKLRADRSGSTSYHHHFPGDPVANQAQVEVNWVAAQEVLR